MTVSVSGRFGNLVVMRRATDTEAPGGPGRQAKYLVKCDCGQTKIMSGVLLRAGKAKSCGVGGHHWRTTAAGLAPKATAQPEYRNWRKMLERCRDAKNLNYGGRGISVCERWKASYAAFFEDMGAKPTPGHTIDRYPNNDGNYEPGNCRWATHEQQSRNMRRTIYVEVDGQRMSLPEYVEKMGLDYPIMHGRLKLGWTLEEALSIPVAKWKNRKPKA